MNMKHRYFKKLQISYTAKPRKKTFVQELCRFLKGLKMQNVFM